MTGQRKKKKARKKLLTKVANEHFFLTGKLYHWDISATGKRSAHRGLGKGCPLFAGLLPKEDR